MAAKLQNYTSLVMKIKFPSSCKKASLKLFSTQTVLLKKVPDQLSGINTRNTNVATFRFLT